LGTSGVCEHQRPYIKLSINDLILSRLDGAWNNVPKKLQPNWTLQIELDDLRQKAQDLIASFPAEKDWLWKDPRTMLTIAFWQELIPNLQPIWVVRHPQEVALSLASRTYSTHMPYREALNLWKNYYEVAFQTVSPENHFIIAYESLFYQPHSEAQRICNYLGKPYTAELEAKYPEIIKPQRRRGAIPFASLQTHKDQLPNGLIEIYNKLTAQAGVVFQQLSQDTTYQVTEQDTTYQVTESITSLINSKLALQESTVQFKSEISIKNEQLSALNQELNDKTKRIQELQQQLRQKELELESVSNYAKELRAMLKNPLLVAKNKKVFKKIKQSWK